LEDLMVCRLAYFVKQSGRHIMSMILTTDALLIHG